MHRRKIVSPSSFSIYNIVKNFIPTVTLVGIPLTINRLACLLKETNNFIKHIQAE